jgi:hypothetical protein
MDNQFVSTAGVYLVMSRLSLNGIHASCTYGNAPSVDILVTSADGSKSLAIQVKTALSAKRFKGRGVDRKIHHFEWNLGYKAAKSNKENLFFTFVDLDQDWDELPSIYIIPSKFIFEFCKLWVDDVSWVRFHPEIDEIDQFKENWNLIITALTK